MSKVLLKIEKVKTPVKWLQDVRKRARKRTLEYKEPDVSLSEYIGLVLADGCGAGSKGGQGFKKGNTCAKGGKLTFKKSDVDLSKQKARSKELDGLKKVAQDKANKLTDKHYEQYQEFLKTNKEEDWQDSDLREKQRLELNAAYQKVTELSDEKERLEKEILSGPIADIPTLKEYGNRESILDGMKYDDAVEKFGQDKVNEEIDAVRKREKDWKRAMNYAISMGEVTQKQAEEKGWWDSSGAKYLPMPKNLYHVTTAADAVERDGLKSRVELDMGNGLGLGGGTDDTISYTDSPKVAAGIQHAMREAHKVATGRKGVEDFLRLAKEGGFEEDFVRHWDSKWNVGDELPQSLKDVRDGTKSKYSVLKMKHIPQETTPEDVRYERFQAFKRFAFSREQKTGELDPLFFSTDVEGFAQIDPEQIRIVRVKSKPGATGYQVNALGEWRSYTGDNVEVTGLTDAPQSTGLRLSLTERIALRLADSCGAGSKGGQGFKKGNTCAKGNNLKKWFGKSKVVDEDGNPLVVYHGTQKPRRIGNEFQEERATSGPMAFFTDDPEVASSYATGKQDTSLEISDLADYFKIDGVPLRKAWWKLSREDRKMLKDKLWQVTKDDDNNIKMGDGLRDKEGWDWLVKNEKRGDHLQAAWDTWVESASLFQEEERFRDVLATAGLGKKRTEYRDPYEVNSAVFPVYLSIEKPLVTDNIPKKVVSALEKAAKTAPEARQYGMDQWDKDTRDPEEWVKVLKDDIKEEKSYAWTSIPDFVTDTLKEQGYDGIKDTGGKMGGTPHTVWIPFRSEQVKSATGNKGTYDPDNPDITLSERIDLVLAGCGAGSAGGKGFSKGNTCAKGGRSEAEIREAIDELEGSRGAEKANAYYKAKREYGDDDPRTKQAEKEWHEDSQAYKKELAELNKELEALGADSASKYERKQEQKQREKAEQYFGIGHGGFDAKEPYQVWAYVDGGVEASDPIIGDEDHPEFDEEASRSATHGTLWGHSITDRNYKGRFEPDTGVLSLVIPEHMRHRDHDHVKDRLYKKFPNITEIIEFSSTPDLNEKLSWVLAGCGAGSQGGKGFTKGNTCASGGKKLKRTLNGEYWIQGSMAVGADTDINDMGHEGYAIQAAGQELAEQLSNSDHELAGSVDPYDEYFDFSFLDELEDDELEKLLKDIYVPWETYTTARDISSNVDPRIWAAKELGWVRVEGNHVQMVGPLTKRKLENVSNGLYDAFGDDADGQEITMEVLNIPDDSDLIGPFDTDLYKIPMEFIGTPQEARDYKLSFTQRIAHILRKRTMSVIDKIGLVLAGGCGAGSPGGKGFGSGNKCAKGGISAGPGTKKKKKKQELTPDEKLGMIEQQGKKQWDEEVESREGFEEEERVEEEEGGEGNYTPEEKLKMIEEQGQEMWDAEVQSRKDFAEGEKPPSPIEQAAMDKAEGKEQGLTEEQAVANSEGLLEQQAMKKRKDAEYSQRAGLQQSPEVSKEQRNFRRGVVILYQSAQKLRKAGFGDDEIREMLRAEIPTENDLSNESMDAAYEKQKAMK